MYKRVENKFTMSITVADMTFAVGSDTEEGLTVVTKDLFSNLGIPLSSVAEVKQDKTQTEVEKELLNGISQGISDKDFEAVETYSKALQRLVSVNN